MDGAYSVDPVVLFYKAHVRRNLKNKRWLIITAPMHLLYNYHWIVLKWAATTFQPSFNLTKTFV